MRRPVILLTNDDGPSSPGLTVLREALEELGEVWTVIPATEQSCISHSLTLSSPIRVERLRERFFLVHGKPADAVIIAIGDLLPQKPGLCVAGVNRGYNLGTDAFYSGTVAAAREAAFIGIPSLAVSVEKENGEDSAVSWGTAAHVAIRVAKAMLSGRLTHPLWNLNVPNTPQVKGIMLSRAGKRQYAEVLRKGGDGFYVIAGTPTKSAEEGTDIWAVSQGFASLTPISVDPTERDGLPEGTGIPSQDPF
ncbi:MAG: 5'/3'-nucleotidase SurE [candidate division WOR-3 bacterium]